MAEERNLVPTAAPAAAAEDDTDATKQELQRRMEEAREQISQTVTEIKETVVNQYQQVRTSINDTLDWREQYRRRPVPFTAGAFGAGLLLGMAVGGAFGEDEEDRARGDFDRKKRRKDAKKIKGSKRPYAASPIIGQAAAFGSSDLGRPALPARGETSPASAQSRSSSDVGPDTRYTSAGGQRPAEQYSGRTSEESASAAVSAGLGSFGASSDAAPPHAQAAPEEPKGPSMFAKFKETKAYDRLQEELSSIGDRVVDELSRTAQTVVLPALLGKLKDMIGIDLGTQKQVAERTRIEKQAAEEQQRASAATEGQASGGRQQQGAGGSANAATGGGRGA
jgi:ElaB/YqjD/DUF883 family membrane-anchored ribosome-binding protein